MSSACRKLCSSFSILTRWHTTTTTASATTGTYTAGTAAIRGKRSLGCDKLSKRHISSSQKHQSTLLYTAVCVERCPVITAEKTKIEQQYADLMEAIDVENSVLSEHEVRRKKDVLALQKKKEEGDEDAGDGETQTTLDLEDRWDAELKSFCPAPRITSADENNDRQSVERCLDTSLYLLVKQKIEGKDHWVLPQVTWQQGETMRQTAERALKSVCGDVKATFLGNAPCGVAKYDLPPHYTDAKNMKLFFYKAWYRDGSVEPNTDIATDYLWVTKEELSEYCNDTYKKHIRKFLL